MECVRRHGEPLADASGRIGTTRALGIDEHTVLGASKDHHTLYATSFVDVTTGQLLDVVRERSADDVVYRLGGDRRPGASASRPSPSIPTPGT